MTPENARDQQIERELAALKSEYERLREDRVRTEQNLKNLEAQLADLEERARAEYGTADPAELEALLAERRAENERLVAEYKSHVDSVRAALAAVESASGTGASGSGNAGGTGR
ncbi:hypothetical protein dsx2_1023 [Desulfovibrio sp. X2]|uniref:hypothetical protein n=1 Tax=Desulfovibrio sp. X2 TaxID=941449 RepID=UPI000358E258|nr:hypothetical protein [Desulfovibrio sp. X2]EPR37080.1 hypothetical protein dsx2_1023 [Desulfovibrio sp. X2]